MAGIDPYYAGDPTSSGLLVGSGGNMGALSYPTPQVAGAQTQTSSPDPWNYGYTHSTGTAPYSGAALTQFQQGQQQYQSDYARTHTSSGGAGAGAGAGTGGGGGGTQGTVDYNAMIQPALDALNGVANSAQSSYDANVSNINTNQATQSGILNQNLTTQQGDVNAARTNQSNLTNNAIQQAKQAYSEIAQGLQSRYGGSTGTGAFANEIAGRQTTTNMAAFQTNLANAMQQLDATWTQVQQNHDNNMKSLNDQTQSAIAQAKSALDTNMANIGMQRGQLQSQKAEMINNAVQNYQQTVNAVNTANTQFAQTLAANLASAGQSVQQAIATAKAIVGTGQQGANQATQGTQNITQGLNGITTPVSSSQTAASALPIGYWVDSSGKVHQGQ